MGKGTDINIVTTKHPPPHGMPYRPDGWTHTAANWRRGCIPGACDDSLVTRLSVHCVHITCRFVLYCTEVAVCRYVVLGSGLGLGAASSALASAVEDLLHGGGFCSEHALGKKRNGFDG